MDAEIDLDNRDQFNNTLKDSKI